MRTRCSLRARRQQARHDGVGEMIERDLVAEEERLVGGHRLDHVDDQALVVARAASPPVAERRDARPCGRAASAGSRPDTACRPTARGRSGPSGACGDSRNRAASRLVSPEQAHDLRPDLIERQHRRADARIARRRPACPRRRWSLRPARSRCRRPRRCPRRRACRPSPCRSGSPPGSRCPRSAPPRRTADRPRGGRN